MFQRILVPLDGSTSSERAIPVAARLARACGGTVIFTRVVQPPVEFGIYAVKQAVSLKPGAFQRHEEAAMNYLKGITSAYAKDLAGIETEIELSTGAAAPEIYSTALLEKVDLIVLYSHGETGLKRWTTGSTAQNTARHTPVPVLVLKEHEMMPGEEGSAYALRVLVPVDGSALSETALEPVVLLLQALSPTVQSEIHFFHVIDVPEARGKTEGETRIPQDYREQAERYVRSLISWCQSAFAQCNLRFTFSLVFTTDVAGAIVTEAERACNAEKITGYDIIAMTTHGRGGLKRLVMGSVTEQVLKATKCPLLIVRPWKAHSEDEELDDAEQTDDVGSKVRS